MKIWNQLEEAERLNKRFYGINRAAFAREHKIKGGQALIYQHINGLRPIGLEAAIAYTKAFQVRLEEISPRLALVAMSALQADRHLIRTHDECAEVRNASESSEKLHLLWISDQETELITNFRKATNSGKLSIMSLSKDMLEKNNETISRS
ncbi:hypothetical protein [Solimicrobium silvestre]|nr:hypothetical protein [Solimicrobium silvestre]